MRKFLFSLLLPSIIIASQPARAATGDEPVDASSPAPVHAVPDPYADVDINVVHKGDLNLDVGGLGQILGLGQVVQDPYTDHDRLYLFMPKARLRLDGNYGRVSMNTQVALGGEDSVNGTSGIDFSLLDFAFNVPLTSNGRTYLKAGQFLVPYGREQLTDPGFQSFADTSVENLGFVVGRDVGLAIVSRPGMATLIAGVFTGGGRDIPPNHYLPERLGIPELVVRAGWGNLDDDPFYLRQTTHGVDQTKYQVSVNGLFMRDSTIGHSTVLNVKSVDKSLLIDSNWNPYIAEGGVGHFSMGDYWQTGADAAVQSPVGGGWVFAGEAQIDYGGYSNNYGSLTMWGARAQAGFVVVSWALALRYDVLVPSDKSAYDGKQITGSQPIQEVAPAATYYVHGDNLKVVFDLPLLINAPVFTEPNVGQYVATQLPDQATVLASETGGSVARQTVPQARLMLQGQF